MTLSSIIAKYHQSIDTILIYKQNKRDIINNMSKLHSEFETYVTSNGIPFTQHISEGKIVGYSIKTNDDMANYQHRFYINRINTMNKEITYLTEIIEDTTNITKDAYNTLNELGYPTKLLYKHYNMRRIADNEVKIISSLHEYLDNTNKLYINNEHIQNANITKFYESVKEDEKAIDIKLNNLVNNFDINLYIDAINEQNAFRIYCGTTVDSIRQNSINIQNSINDTIQQINERTENYNKLNNELNDLKKEINIALIKYSKVHNLTLDEVHYIYN